MSARSITNIGACLAFIVTLIVLPISANAQPEIVQRYPLVQQAYHDESLPVWAYPTQLAPWYRLRPEPRRPWPPHVDLRPDPVVQDLAANPRPMVAATIGLDFDGIFDRDGDAGTDTLCRVSLGGWGLWPDQVENGP